MLYEEHVLLVVQRGEGGEGGEGDLLLLNEALQAQGILVRQIRNLLRERDEPPLVLLPVVCLKFLMI